MNADICALTSLLVLILSAFNLSEGDSYHLSFLPLALALMVFSIIVKIGYTKIFLRIYDGEKPKFSEIFREYNLFLKYVGTLILNLVAVFVGLVLLFFPGFFLAVRLSFSLFIAVDTKVGPLTALKESFAITKGNFWKLLGFWIIILLINMIGFMIVWVGLLATMPITMFASIYVYRELSKSKAGLETASPQIA